MIDSFNNEPLKKKGIYFFNIKIELENLNFEFKKTSKKTCTRFG
jgi:hypothetical protein